MTGTRHRAGRSGEVGSWPERGWEGEHARPRCGGFGTEILPRKLPPRTSTRGAGRGAAREAVCVSAQARVT